MTFFVHSIPKVGDSWILIGTATGERYIYNAMSTFYRSTYLHIGFWVFMTLFVFDYHWFETTWYIAMAWSILEAASYAGIFYLSLLLFRKQSPVTALIGIACLMIAYVIGIRLSGLESQLYQSVAWRNVFSMLLNVSLFTGIAFLYHKLLQQYQLEQQFLRLEANNKQLQIDNLKRNINPHFLFNTLNNMNALISRGDKNLPLFLSKLSSVLRYSFEQGEKATIALGKEVQQMQDYLDLVRLQEPKSSNIDFYTEGVLPEHRIIPFVLNTLLENAVKHGDLMQSENAFLHISLIVEDDLKFEIQNSYQSQTPNRAGTGLANIEKQLQLVYQDKYRIEYAADGAEFKCNLHIEQEELLRK